MASLPLERQKPTQDWRDRLLVWRRRLISNPRFQRWAAGALFTRRLTRNKAQALFDITAGFIYTQLLAACVELDLFARLRDQARDPASLAKELALPEDRCVILLEAARALDLLSKDRQGRYGLGDLGAAVLGTHGLADMIRHHAMLYQDLADPVALLRDPSRPTELNRFWAYAGTAAGLSGSMDPAAVADYSALMTASQGFIADDVLDAFDPGPVAHWADIGGGEGAFISAVAKRHPRLALSLFDLPQVAAAASVRLAQSGLRDRIAPIGGDFFKDALPRADLISLVRVLYDHPDASVRLLLRSVHDALPAHGRLLIAEPMADTPGAERMGAAYFGIYLLAMGGGRSRSVATFKRFLLEAGFSAITCHRTRRPMLVSVLSARKAPN